jgi:hypothetical protein
MQIRNLIIILALVGTLHAQTWTRVATEGQSVTFNSSPITVRFGAPQGALAANGGKSCATVGGCWTPAIVVAGGPPFSMQASIANFHVPDPIPNTVKEMDVLQTAIDQTVTVAGMVVKIPALVGVIAPPPPNTITFSTIINFNGTNVTATCVAPVVKP